MERKDISEISLSKATLDIEDARIYMRMLEAGTLDDVYVQYTKSNCEDINKLANAFINNHSLINFNIARYYTTTPLHVFRIPDWNPNQLLEGLIYSNGIVAILADFSIGETKTILWIKPATIKMFGYPIPMPH